MDIAIRVKIIINAEVDMAIVMKANKVINIKLDMVIVIKMVRVNIIKKTIIMKILTFIVRKRILLKKTKLKIKKNKI